MMDKPMPGLVHRLKRLREARGISQRELAELAGDGVTYSYISRIESGDRRPSLTAVRKLAKPLGVTPLFLETGAEWKCPHCGRT